MVGFGPDQVFYDNAAAACRCRGLFKLVQTCDTDFALEQRLQTSIGVFNRLRRGGLQPGGRAQGQRCYYHCDGFDVTPVFQVLSIVTANSKAGELLIGPGARPCAPTGGTGPQMIGRPDEKCLRFYQTVLV